MTDLAKFYWGYAIFSGISKMLDEGVVSFEVLEELVKQYKATIGTSASELERKLKMFKQKGV